MCCSPFHTCFHIRNIVLWGEQMGMVQTYWKNFIHTLYVIKVMAINERWKRHCENLYLVKFNSNHNLVAIYIYMTVEEWIYQNILISLIFGVMIKRHSTLKSITNGSTHTLCSTTKQWLYGHKESVHSHTYEPNAILQRITWQSKRIHKKINRF